MLFRQVVQGVLKLHSENLVHRDLKFDNIMLHYLHDTSGALITQEQK